MCAATAPANSQADDPPADDARLFRRAVKSTRGIVIAEALAVIMLGFTADDLSLLRFPGYLLGLGVALGLLVGGSLLHGYRLAQRLRSEDEEAVDAALTSYRTRGRVAAIVTAIVFLAWAVFFTQGVPPWAL